MWQAFRQQYHSQGFELVAVGLDTLGAAGCRGFIEAAAPQHPSLIDEHHLLADLYGINNIPQGVWINEEGQIVRPAEAAPAPNESTAKHTDEAAEATPSNFEMPSDIPERFANMMAEASKIQADPTAYHTALRDWIAQGNASKYALQPEEVVARSRPRNADNALGHAHFELATELHRRGATEAAVFHFRRAHELVPDSWTFRRQAWSLRPVGDGPLARFWQGPDPSNPEAWPYEGDWLKDIRESGPENYTDQWRP